MERKSVGTDTEKLKKRRKNKIKDGLIVGICAAIALALVISLITLVFKGFAALFGLIFGNKKAPAKTENTIEQVINDADRLAAGYDYDAALAKVAAATEKYPNNDQISAAQARYNEAKSQLVPFTDISKITHVFFHTLVVYDSLAFDGDYRQTGYNQYMTTVPEFKRMLEQMYAKGYVLIDIHDMASMQTDENGNTVMRPGNIMLPPGKIPFVMSQDDVSYYNYMTGDGFASKIVIGEDSMPTCEYINPDGSISYGDYDLVPILERFINEHPDFSYKGARAILALTGYDGVLGYRTCPSGDGYNEADIEKAKAVAERMKECGWVFASHSWGHQKYGKIDYQHMTSDVEKWHNEVESIIGDTDVMIYANGDDIAGVENYSGEKYNLLKSYGFNYFCNVDSSRYWVQLKDGYLRQGRRNLDGYRMYYNPDMLSDLFDVSTVWDQERPTPVPQI